MPFKYCFFPWFNYAKVNLDSRIHFRHEIASQLSFPEPLSVVVVLNNQTEFSYMYLTVLTDKEVKAKEASRGVNGSEGASPSVSIVVPVYSPNTIPATATTEKENLTAVNENIQGINFVSMWLQNYN